MDSPEQQSQVWSIQVWKICPSKFIPSSDRETLRETQEVHLRLDGPRLKVEVHDSTSRKRLNKYVCLERLQEKPLLSEGPWQHGQTEQSKETRSSSEQASPEQASPEQTSPEQTSPERGVRPRSTAACVETNTQSSCQCGEHTPNESEGTR